MGQVSGQGDLEDRRNPPNSQFREGSPEEKAKTGSWRTGLEQLQKSALLHLQTVSNLSARTRPDPVCPDPAKRDYLTGVQKISTE